MNKEVDYASDSDQSDEDFCPDKADNSDAPSEEESDDPISDNEESSSFNKKSKTKTKTSKTKAKILKPSQQEEHVVSTRNRAETTSKSTVEKDELESDEEDPSRKDALWADFLSDVATTTPNKPASTSKRAQAKEEKPHSADKRSPQEPPKEPEKVKITEIFEFAGEEVRVEKVVGADTLKENGARKTAGTSNGSEPARGSIKRPGGGGLGSILGQIGKKKKISVLEKTKLDWDTFKTTEGIDEELQTFNKGKDGYLQRQDFLERTDLRQFEIEKSIRMSRRKPM